jgi:acyl carrier protein
MIGSEDNEFKKELKELIIGGLSLEDMEPSDIDDDAPLFGGGLNLDSVDALQLSMEIQSHYNIALTDSKEMRRIFTSINTLADYIKPDEGVQL